MIWKEPTGLLTHFCIYNKDKENFKVKLVSLGTYFSMHKQKLTSTKNFFDLHFGKIKSQNVTDDGGLSILQVHEIYGLIFLRPRVCYESHDLHCKQNSATFQRTNLDRI